MLYIRTVPFPGELASRVPAHPTPIHVHVDVDVDIALDIDGDVGSRNRLAQRRCRSDGREERDGDFQWSCCSRFNAVGQIGRRGIVVMPQVDRIMDIVTMVLSGVSLSWTFSLDRSPYAESELSESCGLPSSGYTEL